MTYEWVRSEIDKEYNELVDSITQKIPDCLHSDFLALRTMLARERSRLIEVNYRQLKQAACKSRG